MLDILPPLWMRAGMFAMREFLSDTVTSIFFALTIDGRVRYFHGYCDFFDRGSPERMRDAKRRHFGGDDGIEFIEAERLIPLFDRNPRATHLNVVLTETEIALSLITR